MKFLVIVFFLSTFSVLGDENKVYSVILYHKANPPYSFYQSNKPAGIFVDMFEEISKITDLNFEFLSLSVARGKYYFNNGVADIEPGINPVWRVEEPVPGLYSIKFALSREVILSKNDKTITDIEELYGKVLGKVRGYRHGEFEQHFGRNKIKTVDNNSEKLLLEQLFSDRFKYVMIAEASALYYGYIEKKFTNFNIVYEVSNLPVAMRIHPKHKSLLFKINNALKQMKESGAIEEIYQKYGLTTKQFEL